MFRVEKDHYELEVIVKGKDVKVRPRSKYFYNGFLSRTIARCEEFLAQKFCQENWALDYQSQLEGYFKKRGWQVST